MSAPEHERPFAPAELDALEDALEQPIGSALRLPEGLGDEAHARIGATLARYRGIERITRDLLLTAEPPRAVLDAVIAEARAAAATPSVAPTPRPRWWSGLRRMWLVPALAAAAAVALVFTMTMRRGDEAESTGAPAQLARTEVPAATPAADGVRLADATPMQPVDAREPARGDAVLEAAAAEQRAEGDASVEELEGQLGRASRLRERNDGARGGEADTRTLDTDEPASRKGGARAPLPEPTPAPGGAPSASGGAEKPKSNQPKAPPKPTASPSKDTPSPAAPDPDALTPEARLAQADAARRRGDCLAARRDYDRVVSSGSAKLRARARAGLALCLERDGDDGAARKLVDAARADDPGIDAWLDAER